MKVLKIGGKSLIYSNIDRVIEIIKQQESAPVVVVSAIGGTTDLLERILETSSKGGDYETLFESLKNQEQHKKVNLDEEFYTLKKLFEGVSLLGDYSAGLKDRVLAYGELISGKIITSCLNDSGVKAIFTDSREIIKTDNNFGNATPIDEISRKKAVSHFSKFNGSTVHIVSGFIASTIDNLTTTLGRNGSNYTASLLANYLDAEEMHNYTHVDGIYTANPDLVKSAKRIDRLHYNEANEMATFGASILHAKTIVPLIEKNIPLRILNTFDKDSKGTVISSEPTNNSIKSLSVLSDVSLIVFEGRGFLGRSGIDARIFSTLAKNDISVSVISQGSSERGIGFVVDRSRAEDSVDVLKEEFKEDLLINDVSDIYIKNDISVVSIVGQDLRSFDKPYSALIRNNIVPLLFNNTTTGRNVCIIFESKDTVKALNVIHGQIYGVATKVNIAVFGHGKVGGTLINQILKSKDSIEEKKGLKLNIFAICNSQKAILRHEGIDCEWIKELSDKGVPYTVDSVIEYAKENHLENLIAIDNTASENFVHNYTVLIKSGFDLISSNKSANTISYSYYDEIRQVLKKNHAEYLYETNVGAGLPIIDTIKLLHLSGENIIKIRGVFSGSLSYLFNKFSSEDKPFSYFLNKAIEKGYTEPDAREDLSGNDVGRKLLILARELDLKNEFKDISVENLIPEELRHVDINSFYSELESLDNYFEEKKREQQPNNVLRYVGELNYSNNEEIGELKTKLISVPSHSPLAHINGSDSYIEIYTESYGENPIIIQGAGAGAEVTARGVFGDLLRLANKK